MMTKYFYLCVEKCYFWTKTLTIRSYNLREQGTTTVATVFNQ